MISGKTVHYSTGGVVQVKTDNLSIVQGGVVFSEAGEVNLTAATSGAILASGNVTLDQSQVRAVITRGDVSLDQSGSGVVLARNVTTGSNSGSI